MHVVKYSIRQVHCSMNINHLCSIFVTSFQEITVYGYKIWVELACLVRVYRYSEKFITFKRRLAFIFGQFWIIIWKYISYFLVILHSFIVSNSWYCRFVFLRIISQIFRSCYFARARLWFWEKKNIIHFNSQYTFIIQIFVNRLHYMELKTNEVFQTKLQSV